jgi:hypothetical protein
MVSAARQRGALRIPNAAFLISIHHAGGNVRRSPLNVQGSAKCGSLRPTLTGTSPTLHSYPHQCDHASRRYRAGARLLPASAVSLFIVLHPPSATIVQNYCLNWITNFPRARLRLFGNMMDQRSEGLPRHFIAQLRSWDCAFCRNVPPNVLKTLCSISQNHRGICDRIVLTEGVRIKCYFLSSDVSLADILQRRMRVSYR